MNDEEEEALPARADRDYFPPVAELIDAPERACLTIVLGFLFLVVSVGIWAFVYWRNNPEFH